MLKKNNYGQRIIVDLHFSCAFPLNGETRFYLWKFEFFFLNLIFEKWNYYLFLFIFKRKKKTLVGLLFEYKGIFYEKFSLSLRVRLLIGKVS